MIQNTPAQVWAERLVRFEQLDITVRQFCLDEGVSQPSFYHWRQKLRTGKSRGKNGQAQPLAKFVPVSLPAKRTPEPKSVMTVELPGGIRIRFETSGNNETLSEQGSR